LAPGVSAAAGMPPLRYNPGLLVAAFCHERRFQDPACRPPACRAPQRGPEQADTPINLERPKQAGHGDFASNLALQLAKPLKRNPRDLANLLLAELPASSLVAKAEVAGAGFINFTLASDAKTAVVQRVLEQGEAFGRGQKSGVKVQVEFVSANPTGPLHVGHGRGAAYGASLSDVLDFAGFDVTREYYINDAGRQMDILALSTWLRYLDLFGIAVAFPPNAYQGDYVKDMAAQIKEAHADRFAKVSAADVLQARRPSRPTRKATWTR
jgi:arginyl-tRNA synthetase